MDTDFFLGKNARSVDIKKSYEIMAQLLLLLSRGASSKESNPNLQWSLESFSFDFQHRRKQLRQERASTLLAYFSYFFSLQPQDTPLSASQSHLA